jgi:hypothetical protein
MRFFWIAFLIAFLIATTFPLSVVVCLPKETRPSRWIQNCLPFSVFMLSAFPTAMGIFCVVFFNPSQFSVFTVEAYGATWVFYAAVAALALLLSLACLIVLHDFTSHPIAPYILRGERAVRAFALEKVLRKAGRFGSGSSKLKARREEYRRVVQLDSIRQILRHGSLVAIAYLMIAWVGTMASVFYFWYVAVLVISNHPLPAKTANRLLMVFILLVTWLPMRVYMDWYQNYFYRAPWLRQSYAFWLGVVVAGAGLFFIVFITQPEALVLFCTAVNTSFLVFIGLTGKFKPEWLRAVGEFLQGTPFVYFAAAYTVFLFLTCIIGIRILRTS